MVTKCAGLSPVLFVFGIAGNVTYVASILVISTEAKYLAVNSSWLVGMSYHIVCHTSMTLLRRQRWNDFPGSHRSCQLKLYPLLA